MKLQELPTDKDKLKEMLKKLKDKEVVLEADLAIKEHPRFEEVIMTVMLCMADIRKSEQGIRLIEKPKAAIKKQIETLTQQIKFFGSKLTILEMLVKEGKGVPGTHQQIAFYTNKVETLRQTLEEITGDRSISPVLENERTQAMDRLAKFFTIKESELEAAGIHLRKLLPSLQDYMPDPEELPKLYE